MVGSSNMAFKRIGFLFLILFVLMSGCTQEDVKDEPAKLKIMAYDKDTFLMVYGLHLSIAFPEVEFQILDRQSWTDGNPEQEPGEKMLKFIEQENPDLILLEPDQVMPLADKGRLLELVPMMNQGNFDSTGIPGNMMDYFRQKGNGTLYAIAPTYTPSVIYYNIDLFQQHHIELPPQPDDMGRIIRSRRTFWSARHGREAYVRNR